MRRSPSTSAETPKPNLKIETTEALALALPSPILASLEKTIVDTADRVYMSIMTQVIQISTEAIKRSMLEITDLINKMLAAKAAEKTFHVREIAAETEMKINAFIETIPSLDLNIVDVRNVLAINLARLLAILEAGSPHFSDATIKTVCHLFELLSSHFFSLLNERNESFIYKAYDISSRLHHSGKRYEIPLSWQFLRLLSGNEHGTKREARKELINKLMRRYLEQSYILPETKITTTSSKLSVYLGKVGQLITLSSSVEDISEKQSVIRDIIREMNQLTQKIEAPAEKNICIETNKIVKFLFKEFIPTLNSKIGIDRLHYLLPTLFEKLMGLNEDTPPHAQILFFNIITLALNNEVLLLKKDSDTSNTELAADKDFLSSSLEKLITALEQRKQALVHTATAASTSGITSNPSLFGSTVAEAVAALASAGAANGGCGAPTASAGLRR